MFLFSKCDLWTSNHSGEQLTIGAKAFTCLSRAVILNCHSVKPSQVFHEYKSPSSMEQNFIKIYRFDKKFRKNPKCTSSSTPLVPNVFVLKDLGKKYCDLLVTFWPQFSVNFSKNSYCFLGYFENSWEKLNCGILIKF